MARDGAARRQRLLELIQQYSAVPLVVAGFASIPALVGLLFWDVSGAEEAWFLGVSLTAWALFLAAFALKLAVAPDRVRFLLRNWFDLVVVALPWLRILGLAYLVAFSVRASLGLTRRFGYGLLLLALGVVSIGSTSIFTLERGANPMFAHFGDALWWTFVTVTTVGYGDIVPASGWGRAVAVVLMVGGVVIYSATAAYLASLLLARHGRSAEDSALTKELLEEIRELRRELRSRKDEKR